MRISKLAALLFLTIMISSCAREILAPPSPEELFSEQLEGKWLRQGKDFFVTRLFRDDGTYYYKSENEKLLFFEIGTWVVIGPRLNYGYRLVMTVLESSVPKLVGRSYSFLATVVERNGRTELHLVAANGSETTYYRVIPEEDELPSLLERPVY